MPLLNTAGRLIALTPSLGGESLPIPFQAQTKGEWCWATCIQMMLQKDGDLTTQQCDLANAAFELNGCCASPDSDLCNQPCPIISISGEWARWGYSHAMYSSNSISYNAVQFEIGKQQAVEVGLSWTNGGGHAILIIGWDAPDFVAINDPLANGTGSVHITEITNGFGRGQWKWTWTGIKKG